MSERDDWRDKIAPPTKPPADRGTETSRGSTEDYQAYSTVSANQGPQQTLRFVLKTGDVEAFEYALLARITYRPGRIVFRYTTGETVTVEGRNLDEKQTDRPPLYRAVCDHLVTAITEVDALHAAASELPNDRAVITAVSIKERGT